MLYNIWTDTEEDLEREGIDKYLSFAENSGLLTLWQKHRAPFKAVLNMVRNELVTKWAVPLVATGSNDYLGAKLASMYEV